VVFKKILFFRKEQRFINNFEAKNHQPNLDSRSAITANQALKIIHQKHSTNQNIDRKLALIFEKLKEDYYFGQNFLASIANLSPFIGLFGTVIGVYFALIDISVHGSANIAIIARPIGEALIATAIGLWCAIPASFAYNFFHKKSSSLIKKIQFLIEEELIKINES
jgi:biopolymer transport protein ExbB/TolQ